MQKSADRFVARNYTFEEGSMTDILGNPPEKEEG